MFRFGLLADIGLRATHTVDCQASLRAHLRTLYTLELLEFLHVQEVMYQQNALSALPLGGMEGAYMFTFCLLAQMSLHATHTVDFQANLRAHLHKLHYFETPACPIGHIPAKCSVSSAVGLYGMCVYVYSLPSCPIESPCHRHI
jgi:hypothetical protein